MRTGDFIVVVLMTVTAVGAYIILLEVPLFATWIVALITWSEATTTVLYPTRWPFYLFVVMLIFTVDREYFPTAGLISIYFVLMFYHGKFYFPIDFYAFAWFLLGIVAYCGIGALWLYVKWFSYLRDPKNEAAIKVIPDGQETSFFVSRVSYLYPHFIYWPFSVPHTLITKLLFQLFEFVARRWGGTFGRMVVYRKAELKSQ